MERHTVDPVELLKASFPGTTLVAVLSDPTGPDTVAANDALMTTEQVARMLGVDPSSVRRWRTAHPVQGPPFIRMSDRVVKYRRGGCGTLAGAADVSIRRWP